MNETSKPVEVSGDLIPATSPSQLSLFTSGEVISISNFPDDAVEALLLEELATGPDSQPGRDQLKEWIAMKYWYLHKVEIFDEESERMIEAVRACIITPDNECFHFVSSGVIDSIRRIWGHFREHSFDPPIKVMPVEVKTRKWHTLKLRIDPDSLKVAAGKVDAA